jgi:hypothetical protein
MRTQILVLSVVLFAVGCGGGGNIDYKLLAECGTTLQSYHDANCPIGEMHTTDPSWGMNYCDNISETISSECISKLVDLIKCIEDADPSIPICNPCASKMTDLINCR